MTYIRMTIFIILFISCSSQKDMTRITLIDVDNARYSMSIPKDFEFFGCEAEWQREQRYLYKDSSYIYITNFDISPNYHNIIMLGDSIASFRFQNKVLLESINIEIGIKVYQILPDTFELSGLNAKGLFWKDIKMYNISYGYDNVPECKKERFDNAIKSLHVRGLSK